MTGSTIADLTGGPERSERPKVARSKVIYAPASFLDKMSVVLQNYSKVLEYTIPAEQWSVPGAALPEVGDTALVAFDDDGDIWVIGWSRDQDENPPAGAAGGDLTGAYPNPDIRAGAVGAPEVANSLKPSQGASAATEALRALGTSGSTAAAGNDTRLSDQRVPTDGSVTDAKVAGGAAIAESKLGLASDAAPGTASRRTLGSGAQQAAPGDHVHVQAPLAVVSSLPGSPVDGQEVYYLADSTNGVVWHLKYRAASASAYKWEFVGGSSLYAEVGTGGNETTASTAYVALATAGPSIVLPLAGDYMVAIGCRSFQVGGSAAGSPKMSYDIGGTGAVDADAIDPFFPTLDLSPAQMRERRKSGLTAVTLTAKYRTTAGTGGWTERWMRVVPVRVG